MEQWQALSPAARRAFAGPAPGCLRVDAAEMFVQPDENVPLENFALLLLAPRMVDVVDLRADERWVYRVAGGVWTGEAVW